MQNNDKDNKYIRARERVKETKKFYTSLMSYVIVISFLAGLNYYLDQWGYPLFLWAAFGWGIGLAFGAAKVFNLNPFFGRGWQERKIKEFMQEDQRKSRWQ